MKACGSFLLPAGSLRYLAIIFTVVLVSTMSVPLSAEAPATVPDIKAVDDFLQNTITAYGLPGLAVAIVSDKEVLFASGYGEAAPGVGVEPDTPFLLGSATKAFTALAVMRLAEQGKIDLDSTVKSYLPEFRLKLPGNEDKITVRHLLNHTSGLSDKGMPKAALGEESLEKELLALKECVPDSLPGDKYTYFNVNYRLLGLIIERVSGMRFGEFLEKEIFDPLSMPSTFAGPEGVEALAAGHGQFFGFPFQRKQSYRPGALPSGYLVSSAADISRFLMAELKAGTGSAGILNSGTVKATWSPPGNAKQGYAMGWLAVDDSENGHILIHGGSLENYQSFLYIDPQRKLGFVFLMNQGGLLPALSFNTVRSGLLKMMRGEQPEDGPGQWPVIVLSASFIFFLGIEIFKTARLKTWKSRMARRKPRRQRLSAIAELLGAGFLLFGFIPSMNAIMGDKADWSMIYGLVPELFFLLIISICLGFLRGSIKIWSLSIR